MDDSPKIKVTDRRLFTPDGHLREDADAGEPERASEEAAQPSASSAEAATPRPPTAADADVGRGTDVPFPGEVESSPSIGSSSRSDAPMPGADTGEGVSFFDLVGLLAEPIALYLGDLALPDGQRRVDLDQARVYIDLLGVLEEKTRGNLSQEEEAVLSDLVYRLKMRYVQKRESG